MRNEYRHEMESIGPSQQELDRLRGIIEGGTDMKTKKHIGFRTAAAIAACALVTVTAAAASPTVRQTLAGWLGPFAPYAQDIEGVGCTDQGIQMQVLSALADDLEGRVYLSVQDVDQDRLNEHLELTGTLTCGEWVEPDEEVNPGAKYSYFGTPSTSRFELISYDPEEKTALLSAHILYGDTAQPTQEAQLSLTEMSTTQAALYAGIPCAAVTGETLDSLPGDDSQIVFMPSWLEGGGYGDDVLPQEHVVLAPGLTPMDIEGTEDVRVSSMGFASDGCFHIRLDFAQGVEPVTYERRSFDTQTNTDLYEGQICSMLFSDLTDENNFFSDRGHTIRETLVEGGIDILYPLVTADDLEALRGCAARVYATYIRPGADIEGDWSVDFQMEYHPGVALDWTGTLEGWQVRKITLSPLSVTMFSNATSGFSSAPIYAVMRDGSTAAADPGTGRYINLDACAGTPEGEQGYDAYNTWRFQEPVDLEEVVSLRWNDTLIPVG